MIAASQQTGCEKCGLDSATAALWLGFVDFCQHATVDEFREHDLQVDVTGDTAVVSFAYEMVYERYGERYRATGRDLWVFAKQGKDWLVVWRAMFDLAENPAQRAAPLGTARVGWLGNSTLVHSWPCKLAYSLDV